MKFKVGDKVIVIGSLNYGHLAVIDHVDPEHKHPYCITFPGKTYVPIRANDADLKLAGTELPPGIKGKRDLSEKAHLSYIDPHMIHEAGLGMRYGINKHGFNNHRDMGIEAAQYVLDALQRHLNAYLRGEQTDPESKVNHLACVLNNLNFLYRLDRLHGYEAVLRNVYGETK